MQTFTDSGLLNSMRLKKEKRRKHQQTRRKEENIVNPGTIQRQLFIDEIFTEANDELASDDDPHVLTV